MIAAGLPKREKLSFKVVERSDPEAYPAFAYLDTEKMGGIMFELVQLSRKPP